MRGPEAARPRKRDHAGRSSWRLRRPRRDLSRVTRGKVSQQIRQTDRKLAEPCVLFEQPQKVVGLPAGRTISPQPVGFFKQWRQGGDKCVVAWQCFARARRGVVLPQRQNVVGSLGTPKFNMQRMFDAHNKSPLRTRAGHLFSEQFSPTVSIESGANLSRKKDGEASLVMPRQVCPTRATWRIGLGQIFDVTRGILASARVGGPNHFRGI